MSMLVDRRKTHGNFRDVASVSQGLKEILKIGPSCAHLTDTEREGLEMILHKIARIVCGNPHFKDHWADIAGYATRVEEDCNV